METRNQRQVCHKHTRTHVQMHSRMHTFVTPSLSRSQVPPARSRPLSNHNCCLAPVGTVQQLQVLNPGEELQGTSQDILPSTQNQEATRHSPSQGQGPAKQKDPVWECHSFSLVPGGEGGERFAQFFLLRGSEHFCACSGAARWPQCGQLNPGTWSHDGPAAQRPWTSQGHGSR